MGEIIRSGWQIDGREEACLADIGWTEEELREFLQESVVGFQQMPASGKGFECYGPSHKRYGRPEVIRGIQQVTLEWHERFPNGPRLGIGNISLENGGPMPPHVSHQRGVDVDIAPIAKTADEIPLTWRHPKYSRERTQLLVNLMASHSGLKVRVILFNDPQIAGASYCAGHDNHLHVSFYPAHVQPSPFSSDQHGNLRLVTPNLSGPRVMALQKNLTKVGIVVRADGIFGPKTEAAVKQFQGSHGLVVDGIAGPETLAKLASLTGDESSMN